MACLPEISAKIQKICEEFNHPLESCLQSGESLRTDSSTAAAAGDSQSKLPDQSHIKEIENLKNRLEDLEANCNDLFFENEKAQNE